MVILEKIRRLIEVSKLRAILLLEADYNTLNRLVFNIKLTPSLKINKQIPYEIIGDRRGYSAIHITLNKKLVSDIANQSKKSTVIILVDATSCYNHITHSIVSLVCQYFRLSLEYVLLLFRTIQIIKIFL